MNQSEPQLIHAFTRNDNTREKIQIHLKPYNGEFYVDIRLWYRTQETPEMRPTKKGIYFNLRYLDDLIAGLEQLGELRDRLRKNEAIPSQ